MGSRKERLENASDRYQSLRIKEHLSTASQYPFACKELTCFLKNAYSHFPKHLQSLLFQDTLFAFTLLPQIQTQSAISAANSLLQSAEFALPKQKRALAVTEYKHAVVAIKRKSKTNKEDEEEEEGLAELPQEVLVHVFGFLDVRSLLSASAVCRLWNAAACDNYLWKLFYDTYFSDCNNVVEKGVATIRANKNEIHQTDNSTSSGVNYRFAFSAAYKDGCHGKLGYHRGYCSSCCSIVWLSRNRCSNGTRVNHQIKPISVERIVEFVLDGFASSRSSSDSDSDTEDVFASGLWVYPKVFS